jgi:hypothetical protein
VLNTTAYTVANFRTQVIANNVYSAFTTSSAGWAPTSGSWALYGGTYYRTAGVASHYANIKSAGVYGDVTLTARMSRTGTCTGCANYIMVRGVVSPLSGQYDWSKAYFFQYANDGTVSVYVNNGTSSTALKTWTASAAVVKNGWNTLQVKAVGNYLRFYVNNTLVWSGYNGVLLTGVVGAGYYRDAAAGVLTLDSASVVTTATADTLADERVEDGVVLPGGTREMSPSVK